jgi:N-acetyl-gamma-glutamyl-phosphate reductase
MERGILTTVYLKLLAPIGLGELHEIYRLYYRDSPFVRVRPLGSFPETADVRGTNLCDLALYFDEASGLHKVVSVIDNLCRGAAGQAVANLNLMTGRAVTHGLALAPFRP